MAPATLIRVLLVEDNPSDHELSAVALSAENADGFEIVSATSLESAVAILANRDIDAVLLDLNLPDSDGLDTCREMFRAAPDVPIVVLTGLNDEKLGVAALEIGAQDYLTKDRISDGSLCRSIRFAIARAEWKSADVARVPRVSVVSKVDGLSKLTLRERETLELLTRGMTLKQIAVTLGISAQTAAKHRSRILAKLGVANDVELVRLMLDGERP